MTGQNITLSNLPNTQPEYISALMKLVPVNQLGLPEGIYRPDLLPAPPGLNKHEQVNMSESDHTLPTEDSDVPAQEQAEQTSSTQDIEVPYTSPEDPTHSSDLEPEVFPAPALCQQLALNEYPEVKSAYVPLSYQEGFPTLVGIPFWVQLQFEPIDAYECFDLYLKQGRKGARQLYLLSDSPSFPEGITEQLLLDFSEMYFWSARAKSYDMFSAAHRRKERERRAIDTENEHYLIAERLMKIAECYLDDQGEELAEMMTPKMLLEFIKTSSQLQRISAGLPGNGPSNRQEVDGPIGESVPLEIIMRTIAKESGAHVEADIVDSAAENRSKLSEILKDESAIELAQELIIKVNNPKEIANTKEMETV